MLSLLQALAVRALTAWKYRRLHFGSVGLNCDFKARSSTYLYPERIHIGNDVHIGPRAMVDGCGRVDIGEGCIFGPEIKIFSRSHNFDQNLQALPFDHVMLTAPVNIGRYVWLGSNAIILPGVTIGEGAVIGAGAVVARDIPPYAVATGNPATVVRFRNAERFQTLVSDKDNFVYRKFGHRKETRPKTRRPRN